MYFQLHGIRQQSSENKSPLEFFKDDRLKLKQVVHQPICYDVIVISFPYPFLFSELKRIQNILHGITEFLSTIILCQRKPNGDTRFVNLFEIA